MVSPCKLEHTCLALVSIVFFKLPLFVHASQLQQYGNGVHVLGDLAGYIDRVFASPREYEAFPESGRGRKLVADGPIVNVMDKGAKGDGMADDSAAFKSAFLEVCAEGGTVLVPQGQFYIPHLDVVQCIKVTFQVEGTLLAPESMEDYPDPLSWLHFSLCDQLSIVGKGTLDARGQWGWKAGFIGRHTLYLERCTSVLVREISIIDSPRFSLYCERGERILIEEINIVNSISSIATDAVHFAYGSKIVVRNNNIQTGDDCIVLQTHIDTALVTGNTCRGGDGIGTGVGGATNACIKNVVVESNTIIDARHGCRIKSWTNSTGAITNYICRNNMVENVKYAMMINMEYCNLEPSGSCGPLGKVVLYKALFIDIRGTTSSDAGYSLKCGNKCGVALYNIDVSPRKSDGVLTPICTNVYGVAKNVFPPSCVQSLNSTDLSEASAEATSCNFAFPNGGYETPEDFDLEIPELVDPSQASVAAYLRSTEQPQTSGSGFNSAPLVWFFVVVAVMALAAGAGFWVVTGRLPDWKTLVERRGSSTPEDIRKRERQSLMTEQPQVSV